MESPFGVLNGAGGWQVRLSVSRIGVPVSRANGGSWHIHGRHRVIFVMMRTDGRIPGAVYILYENSNIAKRVCPNHYAMLSRSMRACAPSCDNVLECAAVVVSGSMALRVGTHTSEYTRNVESAASHSDALRNALPHAGVHETHCAMCAPPDVLELVMGGAGDAISVFNTLQTHRACMGTHLPGDVIAMPLSPDHVRTGMRPSDCRLTLSPAPPSGACARAFSARNTLLQYLPRAWMPQHDKQKEDGGHGDGTTDGYDERESGRLVHVVEAEEGVVREKGNEDETRLE